MSSKKVSATEAKSRFGALLREAQQTDGEIVIASRGRPQAVLISYDRYMELQTLAEEARRRRLLERLEALGRRIQEEGKPVSLEEAEVLAERFGEEFVEDLIAEGRIRYQGR